jgi:hypothetical protein
LAEPVASANLQSNDVAGIHRHVSADDRRATIAEIYFAGANDANFAIAEVKNRIVVGFDGRGDHTRIVGRRADIIRRIDLRAHRHGGKTNSEQSRQRYRLSENTIHGRTSVTTPT